MYNLLELLVWQGKSRVWQRLVRAKRKHQPPPRVQIVLVDAAAGLFMEEGGAL